MLGFAVAAGSVAAVNPCGFAMLPAYLTLVVVGDDGERRSRASAVARAQGATLAMAVGFLVVFGTFGLVVAPLAASAQRYLPGITVVIGVLLIGLGAWMLTGREVTVLLPKPRQGAPTARLGSMFGYGLAYAFTSLSCTIGPFLAVTSATFRSGSILGGVVAYLAYGAGMALVVGVLATTVALAGQTVTTRARRLLPHINRIGGGLLVLVGSYVGYYGVYELRLYFGGADARDPVIAAAGAIQHTLQRWVDGIGVWPMIVALAVLVLGAVPLGWGVKRRSRRHGNASDSRQAGSLADRGQT
jgi:cytochrome c-type biogenesis protein